MSDSTELYLIRHGETDYNLRSIIQGQLIDCPLNDTGRNQALVLAKILSTVRFDAFYCSTLKRAEETARIVAAPHAINKIEKVEGLQEMSFGQLEGQPYNGKNQRVFDDLAKQWSKGAFGGRPGNGESIIDVQKRAVMGIEKIAMQNPGRTVAVVTHGKLLRVLLSTIIDGYSLERMEDLLHRNTAFSRITATGTSYQAVVLASDDHLESASIET